MKKYEKPQIENINTMNIDIIATSCNDIDSDLDTDGSKI